MLTTVLLRTVIRRTTFSTTMDPVGVEGVTVMAASGGMGGWGDDSPPGDGDSRPLAWLSGMLGVFCSTLAVTRN